MSFVEWAAARKQAKSGFDQMLISAALESAASRCVALGYDTSLAVNSFVTLVVVYRVVDFEPDERVSALLRRCAGVSLEFAGQVRKTTICELAVQFKGKRSI